MTSGQPIGALLVSTHHWGCEGAMLPRGQSALKLDDRRRTQWTR